MQLHGGISQQLVIHAIGAAERNIFGIQNCFILHPQKVVDELSVVFAVFYLHEQPILAVSGVRLGESVAAGGVSEHACFMLLCVLLPLWATVVLLFAAVMYDVIVAAKS